MTPFHTVPSTEIPDDEEGLDIGEKQLNYSLTNYKVRKQLFGMDQWAYLK